MQVVNTIAEVRAAVRAARSRGQRIGFVPTMGYLHEGHLSLVAAARAETDLVVVSLFVNPLQFGPNEDLARYPRDLERDQRLLEAGNCDLLFAPSVDEMYPRPMETEVNLPNLAAVLCGRSRPTHFRGVATVVCKLFQIVQPDVAFFGQKDAQQVAVVRRMVEDLSIPVEIRAVPTVREPDGLAKSSRNVYLTPAERADAPVLYRALQAGVQRIEAGERRPEAVREAMVQTVAERPSVRLDYAEVVDGTSLRPLAVVDGYVLLAIAAYLGRARLIDNVQLHVSADEVRRV
ncbi:MAG: pantoate--beta-alanine ligase [Alicyclobacillus sp.]|nr:pantoate--beta-alanine ligase [Alicyclobacillus sp.]